MILKRQNNDKQNPDPSADLIKMASPKCGYRSGGARNGAHRDASSTGGRPYKELLTGRATQSAH